MKWYFVETTRKVRLYLKMAHLLKQRYPEAKIFLVDRYHADNVSLKFCKRFFIFRNFVNSFSPDLSLKVKFPFIYCLNLFGRNPSKYTGDIFADEIEKICRDVCAVDVAGETFNMRKGYPLSFKIKIH